MNTIDWQTVANIATSVAVVLALAVFVWEMRSSRREREYQVFFRYVDAYERLETRRLDNWRKLKDAIQSNPNTKEEIGDKTNSIEYLMLRARQAEPMYAIEHNVLELEIQSLNLLNEMCRYALRDSDRLSLLKAMFAKEISFYQHSLPQILQLREQEKAQRLFSIPKYESLQKCDIGDVFDVPK